MPVLWVLVIIHLYICTDKKNAADQRNACIIVLVRKRIYKKSPNT